MFGPITAPLVPIHNRDLKMKNILPLLLLLVSLEPLTGRTGAGGAATASGRAGVTSAPFNIAVPYRPAQRSPNEVLLVYNTNSPISVAVANYYKLKRGVTNTVAIGCIDSAVSSVNENIPWTNYTAQIAAPVTSYLSNHANINFIVLTKGVPIRIGGSDLGYLGNGDYTWYNGINVSGATGFTARVANPGSRGSIQIRLDSNTGTLLGTCPVPVTGGYQIWTNSSCALSAATGTHKLYLVYSGGFNVEWFALSNSPNEIQATSFSGASANPQGEVSSEGGTTTTGSETIGITPINYTPSVDSYLAAVDYPALAGAQTASITGSGATGVGWINRYYNTTAPFTHAQFGGYLVTRLDGYTQTNACALVDRALAAEQSPPRGSILLDVEPDFGVGDKTTQPLATPLNYVANEVSWDTWNADMLHAADLLEANGIACDPDISPNFVGNQSGLLGYFSFGSNDDHFNQNAYETLDFAPGAICDTAVSTSARTFLPTVGGQTLIADLITNGMTGVRGYVAEPLLDAIASPTIVLAHFLTGYTLAESFSAAGKYTGWEDVAVGDPLCSPYLNPGRNLVTPIQASSFNGSAGGVNTENCAESAFDVGNISNGAYTCYNNITLNGVTNFVARVASAGPGGSIQVRLDSPAGTLIGTCTVPVTSSWQAWTTVSCGLAATNGRHTLYLVYAGGGGYLFNVEWFALLGVSVLPPAPAGLRAQAGDAQVALTWNTSTNALGYNVKSATISGGPYAVIASGLTTSNFTATGLANGTVYYYAVSAVNLAGESTNSLEISSRPVSSTVPSFASQLSAGQITLDWPADHTGWLLQAQTNAVNAGIGSNWVTVLGSTGTNQMAFSLNPAQNCVFYRLAHP